MSDPYGTLSCLVPFQIFDSHCRVVENELAAALSGPADLDFVCELSLIGDGYLAARRWACWQDHCQGRSSAVDFVALVRHTARGRH